MAESVITAVIVAFAAVLFIRRIYKTARRGGGCDCCDGCNGVNCGKTGST